MNDPMHQSTDTTLIAASNVEGKPVFDAAGEKLGAIKDLYLDKTSGTVEFAALAFGGLLGVGVKYHPLPWQELDYDTTKGGFVVEIDKADLERSPAYEADRLAGNETAWRNEVRTYYADLPGERPGPAI